MSDFRELLVYQKTRSINKDLFLLMKENDFDRIIRNQLTRASTSIQLNIAEGAGRLTIKDQRNFYVIARGSAMECIALFDLIEDLENLPKEKAELFRGRYTEVCRMLYGLIKRLSKDLA